MTRYRRLKRQPVMPRESSACSVFAGICVVLMMSCALAGLAMSTKGAEFATINLVDHEGQYKWKVQDRDVDPTTMSTFSIRKPAVTEDGGLSFELNTVSSPELPSDLYTVYLVWYGSLDLSAASEIEVGITMTYTGDLPIFVCRNIDFPYTAWSYDDGSGNLAYYTPHVKVHILGGNGDSWEPCDYWWCTGVDEVNFAYLDGLSIATKTVSWTLTVPLTNLAIWSDRNGGSAVTEEAAFAESLENVVMIGLAFGGNCFGANGVAVLNAGSTATFELESYEIS